VRVGLVCPYSLTVPGGVQGQVLGLARALRSGGIDARILAPSDGPPPDPAVTSLGRSIPTASNGSVAPLAPDVSAQLRTIRALRDEEFDVVHLHEPICPGPTVTALLTCDEPLVGTFHRAGASKAYFFLTPLVRWGARKLDVRVAVSRDAMTTAKAALGGEYELAFNGVEVERFAKGDVWPTEAPTIFFIGRHEHRKGLAVLLDALADVPGDLRVWVAGEGPETNALRTGNTDERVEWLGRIEDDELAARLRAADVFCAPSLHGESSGVVLLESMAAQTPIVASDLPGYRNVARPDELALLVPPGDARALAGALRRVLGEPSLVTSLVEAGSARAEEFSMTRLADRYADLYERIAGR
jgi:phosphatidylinositol alpha-mannosyltransferase